MTVHPSTELVEEVARCNWERISQLLADTTTDTWETIPAEVRINLREYWLEHLNLALPVLVAHGWTPPQEGQ